ncbi:MAG: hypothetical protein A2275_04635 [Bacteroidetes bacterium RIFOXYA12_FULL_35_11]|nr:MAG: hypothetical protein A2X01_11155 [Bacteroidetes bacterium GWF2_35_48]OFY75454.1 MAG: hypothetical protein A2275_04635 [Bacteroidetes bacterium RIFOXYA12_FULL_35_11]OFY96119.1 MAG: hypothetical protein A2491_05885 [Bacteroidetes bacterium RIFOXYC12_FULL_35_7]HBX51319.1 DNA-binding response regulator [Bacteroidales bacterium]
MNEKDNSLINILVVDDHQIFIDGIKLVLRKAGNIKVVAQALSGKQAIEIVSQQQIDLVLTDIQMPEMSGTELIKWIKKEFPQIKILVLTSYNERNTISEIIDSEAEGYILKNVDKHELIAAINKIYAGGVYFCNEAVSIMLDNMKPEKKQAGLQVKELTIREVEILQLICQEYSNVEIAAKLFISPLTVETHRKHIFHKTNSKTIVGLIKFAIFNNIVS